MCAGVQVCLACHASRPLVGVGFSDGLCRLYDYSRATLDRGGGGGMGPIAGGDTGASSPTPQDMGSE